MRSATTRAAARSWVTNSMAMPSSRRSRPSRLSTVAASDTSSALVGSSHSSTSGGTTVARASATRWRWPPDSWPALASRHLGGQTDAGAGPPATRSGARRLGPCRSVAQPLADQLADGHPRRQRRAGVLEHHLGPAAVAELDRRRRRWGAGRRRPAAASTCRSRSRRRGPPTRPRSIARSTPAEGLERRCARGPRPRVTKRLVDARDDDRRGSARSTRRRTNVGGHQRDRGLVGGRRLDGGRPRRQADARRPRPGWRRPAPARAGAVVALVGAVAQRGANGQPGGGSRGSGGSPGSVGSGPLASGVEREPGAQQARGVGVARPLEHVVRRARPRPCGRRRARRCGRRSGRPRRGRG